MLLNFFRKSYQVQHLMLVLLMLIMWGSSFILPPHAKNYDSIAFSILSSLDEMNRNYYILSGIISFMILLGQAYFFNFMLVYNGFISRNSVLGVFVFICFISFDITLNYLSPVLLANTFILIMLFQVFRIYRNPEEYQTIFNIGAMVSIASLMYLPAIWLVIFIIATFLFFRMVKWREYVNMLFGVLLPYLFYTVYLYWNDSFFQKMDQLKQLLINFSLDFNFGWGIIEASVYILGMLFILFSFIYLAFIFQEQPILIRRNLSSVISLLFIGLAVALLYSSSAIILTVIPAAIIISFALSRLKKNLVADTFIILFLLLIIANNLILIFQ